MTQRVTRQDWRYDLSSQRSESDGEFMLRQNRRQRMSGHKGKTECLFDVPDDPICHGCGRKISFSVGIFVTDDKTTFHHDCFEDQPQGSSR